MWCWTLILSVAQSAPLGEPDSARLSASLREAALEEGPPVQVVVEWESTASSMPARVLALAPSARAEAQASTALQLWVPRDRLRALAALEGVTRVRAPFYARPKEVTSEGVGEVLLEDWGREGITGDGVRVDVLDVGFAGYKALVGEDLPIGLEVALQSEDQEEAHGTAVGEIIYDMAPGISLVFHQFATDVEYLELMESLLNEGDSDVINASIGFDNIWSLDGSSPYSQIVVYVAPSGNEVGNYVIGTLSDSDDNTLLEIDGLEAIPLGVSNGEVQVSVRWSETMGEAAVDLDIAVLDENGEVCGESNDYQGGEGFPFESVACELAGTEAWLVLVGEEVALDGLTAFVYSPFGVDDSVASEAMTLTLPSDARGAITVGAYYAYDMELADYSSQGPTEDGRIKPDLVGPTGVSTESLGALMGEGSSFSAPHVAGLVALMLEADPDMEPGEVRDYLHEHALDLGEAGPDNVYGWGAAQSGPLPESCGCATPRGGSMPNWGWIPVLLLWRRR